jgi:ketosteroid isomerase-like protein
VSAGNLAIVRTLVDGMDRPDLPELLHRVEQGDTSVLAEFAPLLELLDPEILWDVSSLEIPDLGVFHGHEGVVTFWLKWMAEWESWAYKADNFEEIGDHVLYDIVLRGKSRRMGAEVEWRQSYLATLRAGKVVAYRAFANRAEALEVIRD